MADELQEKSAQPRIQGTEPLPVSPNSPTAASSQVGAQLNTSLTGRSPEDAWEERGTTKSDRQEIFLPVSGFVWFFPEEIQVINHPAFQRLARIYQLGQAYYVYRGATHKRLEHVLGAVHIVQRIIAAVNTNSEKFVGESTWAPPLSASERRFVRLGTLLHDIGHLAAGHTLEDELQLISKHDGDKRLDFVFQEGGGRDRSGRTLGELINQLYQRYVPKELRESKVEPSEIVRLLVRKQPTGGDGHERQQHSLEQSHAVRLQICKDMIGNTICADILDYIYRDWYHVGKPRPFDDRLLQYMEVRRDPSESYAGPEQRFTDRFVISLGKRPKIRTDAVSHILELLEWRYSLSETVLFHRTKLAAASMLDRALYELWGATADEDEVVRFLFPLSDEEMLSRCRERAVSIQSEARAAKDRKERAAVAEKLLGGLERREIFSFLSTRFLNDLPGDVVENIKSKYARHLADSKLAPRNRNSVLRTLEQDFALPAGSLAMYCPSAVNKKIAEVQIAVGNEIEKFSEYERKHNDQLAGGHLAAQLRRFDQLWRVHFFIDREVKSSLGDRLSLRNRRSRSLHLATS